MGTMVVGVIVGMFATLPIALVLAAIVRGQQKPGMATVFAAALSPFLVLQLVLLAVYLRAPQELLAFGVSSVIAFLATATIVGLAAWRFL